MLILILRQMGGWVKRDDAKCDKSRYDIDTLES